MYDAQGNRLQKRVFDKNTNITDTFDYIGNFVYKNGTLQYILNSEGRARPVPGPGSQPETKFKYDYFVKDHLGNVRSTVMADPIDAQYLASHEIGMANVEQLLFDNIPNVRDAKPGGGGMAARLDGGDASRRVGTAMMLKVMPGDRFTISADAYYEGDYQQSEVEGAQAVIESLASALLGGQTYDGIPLSELPDNVRTITQTLNNPALAGQLENLVQSTNNNNAPRAHLNILFFNDKMELIEGGSSVTQVPAVPQGGSLGGFITLTPNAQNQYAAGTQPVCCTSPGPGYVLVYVDNQSIGKDVWFDNIMIEHYTGRIQEEDHYYPFGLTVQTWENPNHKEQPYKYNCKELEKSFGMEMYDYGSRMQDPQLGRWFGIDPMGEKFRYESPYTYAGNNPIKNIDLGGKLKMSAETRSFSKILTDYLDNYVREDIKNSPTIIEAFKKYGQFNSTQEILDAFTPGKGPTLEFANPVPGGGNGYYVGGAGNNEIMLVNSQLVYNLEEAKTPEERLAALIVVMSTIYHEGVHYGDLLDGDNTDNQEVSMKKTKDAQGNVVEVPRQFPYGGEDKGGLFENDVYFNGDDKKGQVDGMVDGEYIRKKETEAGDPRKILPTVPPVPK